MNYPNPIDPGLLDLVMRDHDHAIYYADKVMLTPKGADIADPDIRLLKHMLAKMTINKEINLHKVNSFALFCFHRDCYEQENKKLLENFNSRFTEDLLFRMVLGQRSTLLDANRALIYLENHPSMMNLIFWGMPEVGRRLRLFIDFNCTF